MARWGDCMFDIHLELENDGHELGRFGTCLGKKGFSVEGGGAWLVGSKIQAHFLFQNGKEVADFLISQGFKVVAVSQVLIQKLRQDQPGQLGSFCAALGEVGVKIQVLYSDHHNQLIVVPNQLEVGKKASLEWMENNWKT